MGGSMIVWLSFCLLRRRITLQTVSLSRFRTFWLSSVWPLRSSVLVPIVQPRMFATPKDSLCLRFNDCHVILPYFKMTNNRANGLVILSSEFVTLMYVVSAPTVDNISNLLFTINGCIFLVELHHWHIVKSFLLVCIQWPSKRITHNWNSLWVSGA